MNRRNLFNGGGNYIDFAGQVGYENGYDSIYIVLPDETKVYCQSDGKLYLEDTEYESLKICFNFGNIDFTNSNLHLTGSGCPISVESPDIPINHTSYINTSGLWCDSTDLEGAFRWDGDDAYPVIFGGYFPNITTMEYAFNSTMADRFIFRENTMDTGINNFQNCDNFRYLFVDAYNLKSIDFSNLNSLSGNFSYAFMQCQNLEEIKFPKNFAPTDFGNTFNTCTSLNIQNIINKLAEKDLSNLTNLAYAFANTSTSGEIIVPFPDVDTLNDTFQNCTNITSVKFPNMEASGSGNAKTMTGLFQGCTSLEEVQLPATYVASSLYFITKVSGIFSGCSNLQKVDASRWAGRYAPSAWADLKSELAKTVGGTWTNNNGILTRDS